MDKIPDKCEGCFAFCVCAETNIRGVGQCAKFYKMVEEKFTSTNKPIMPLPTLEEVQESFAYNPDGIKKHVTGDEYSAIQFTYDYLTRQQHNV